MTALLAPERPARLQVFRADGMAASPGDPASAAASAVRLLGTALAGAVAFHTVRLAPGGRTSHPEAERAGRVVAVVVRGTVEVTVEEETLTLDEHDALQADTAAALRWRNTGVVTALIHTVCARTG